MWLIPYDQREHGGNAILIWWISNLDYPDKNSGFSFSSGHAEFIEELQKYIYIYIVEDEDVVGATPTGDAPTTSECSTIVLPIKVRVILETWRDLYFLSFRNTK